MEPIVGRFLRAFHVSMASWTDTRQQPIKRAKAICSKMESTHHIMFLRAIGYLEQEWRNDKRNVCCGKYLVVKEFLDEHGTTLSLGLVCGDAIWLRATTVAQRPRRRKRRFINDSWKAYSSRSTTKLESKSCHSMAENEKPTVASARADLAILFWCQLAKSFGFTSRNKVKQFRGGRMCCRRRSVLNKKKNWQWLGWSYLTQWSLNPNWRQGIEKLTPAPMMWPNDDR